MKDPVYGECEGVVYIRADKCGIPHNFVIADGFVITRFEGAKASFLRLDDVIAWYQREQCATKDSRQCILLQKWIDHFTNERGRLQQEVVAGQETTE